MIRPEQALEEFLAKGVTGVIPAGERPGHSGATLVRPALEALRDLAAQGCVDVVLCYSPDRLARKFAYYRI